jgi:hypothetical protein
MVAPLFAHCAATSSGGRSPRHAAAHRPNASSCGWCSLKLSAIMKLKVLGDASTVTIAAARSAAAVACPTASRSAYSCVYLGRSPEEAAGWLPHQCGADACQLEVATS